MRVLERRFLRGPNIHRAAPCFMSVLDLEGHRPTRLQAMPGDHAMLQLLLPRGFEPTVVDAGDAARLVARLIFMTQAWAGSCCRFWNRVTPLADTTTRYRMVCDYTSEAVAEEALRISLEIVTALMARKPVDIEAALTHLRAMKGARVDPPVMAMPVVAVTGTNGKTTTTQLIAHVLRAGGLRTGAATTQGIYINGQCVETGDCSGYWSARRVLTDPAVDVAALETARGGILKRGLGFNRCDVGVVLNVSSDHLGLDGIETLQDLAHVKGLVARCARHAAVLNADDALCVAMQNTLAPGCRPVFFTLDAGNPVFAEHLLMGGMGACLDDKGWLVWCSGGYRTLVVKAAELPFTWQGNARYNTANALGALAALRCMGVETTAIAQAMSVFVSDARTNPLRGNQFEVDGVKLIVDYAHNAVACQAVCDLARSLLQGDARLLGVITAPGDRRAQDLHDIGAVCGRGFDELVVYEQDPRGSQAGTITGHLLQGARRAAPAKPMRGELHIRKALWLGLTAAQPGDVLVFTCAGSFDDLVEGVRLKSPAAAEEIARAVSR